MKSITNKIVLAGALGLLLASSAGANAGVIISDHRYFPNEARSVSQNVPSALDAQASIYVPAADADNRTYQGGPKTGTGFRQ
ncbi:MAG: hypothetical protein K2X60_06390 [Xanthobacteraceae bacterium]|nr:hypothetical protein [Xanthobacteraceae bacterium]